MNCKDVFVFVLNRNDILPIEDVAFLEAYEGLYKPTDRSSVAVTKNVKNGSPTLPLPQGIYTEHWTVGLLRTNFIYTNSQSVNAS